MNISKKELMDSEPIVKLDWSADVESLRQFYLDNRYQGTDTFGADISSAVLDGAQYLDVPPEEYWPLNITTLSEDAQCHQDGLDLERGMTWQEHQKTLSAKRRLRAMLTFNEDYDPAIDERYYTQLTSAAEGTYIEDIRNKFKGSPGRTRFTKLDSKEAIRPHVDSIPQHIVRAIIPIWTNDECINGYRMKGVDYEIHLELGNVYIINAGLPHWATNNGLDSRVHLIITLCGPDDLLRVNRINNGN
jgi:hypothetical protein